MSCPASVHSITLGRGTDYQSLLQRMCPPESSLQRRPSTQGVAVSTLQWNEYFSLRKVLQLKCLCTPILRLVSSTAGPAVLHLTCQSSFSISLFWGLACCQLISNGPAARTPLGCTLFSDVSLQPYTTQSSVIKPVQRARFLCLLDAN